MALFQSVAKSTQHTSSASTLDTPLRCGSDANPSFRERPCPHQRQNLPQLTSSTRKQVYENFPGYHSGNSDSGTGWYVQDSALVIERDRVTNCSKRQLSWYGSVVG